MVRSQILSRTRFYTWFMVGATAGLWMVLAIGCDCEGVPSELQVQGVYPYVRCHAIEPPGDRTWRVGDLELTRKGRQLRIDGPQRPLLAVYAGPAFARRPPTETLEALREAQPDLAWMIGGIGDTEEQAARNLALVAQAPFPTLILAGGRDHLGDLRRALASLDAEARDRIIDVTGMRIIQWGDHVMIPVAGAVGGRYARDAAACGLDKQDLVAISKEVGKKGAEAHRWLVAWHAPALDEQGSSDSGPGGQGVTTLGLGLDIGDADLGALARTIGAKGGLFAWPEVQVMRPKRAAGSATLRPGQAYPDLRLVVPPIAGPGSARDDGSWQPPGFALLRLDKEGMMLSASD